MAEGVIHERVAPGTVRLPDQVVKGLDEAWARSQKSGHEERGGNIVKTYWGGEYDFRHGGDKDSTDKDSWMPDRKDKRTGQEFIGTYHTHDYAGEKHEYPYGTFSDSDVANIADMEDRLKLVRSGDRTFMLSRTQEFDAMAKKYENDPEAMAAFQMQIRDTYNAAYKKALGGDASRNPEALEAGVRAAAQKYHLLYYSGQGAMLRRVAGGPPAK